jgi:hypothetical protein
VSGPAPDAKLGRHKPKLQVVDDAIRDGMLREEGEDLMMKT